MMMVSIMLNGHDIGNDNVCVILGDNVTDFSITKDVLFFDKSLSN